MVLMAVVVGLMAGVGRGVAAQQGDDKAAKADAIIQAVSDYYGSLKSMKLRATVLQTVSVGGSSQSLEVGLDFVAERPNRFSMRPAKEDQPLDTAVVSDGETLTQYVSDGFIKRYSEEPAPGSLEAITYTREFMAMSGGIGQFVVPLFSEDPADLLVDAASSFEYLGEREREGVTYDVLERITPSTNFEYYFSQGAEPKLVYVLPDLSEMMLEQRALGAVDYEASIVFTFSGFEPDVELAAGEFAFEVAEDMEKVESLFPSSAQPGGFTEGEAAPGFELERLAGGVVSLEEHLGKDIVMLDFWATWCGPCRMAMPILEEVAGDYADRNVVLYAVNLQEAPADIRAFLTDEGLDVDVLMDKTGGVADAFMVAVYPTTIIIDKQGIVRKVQRGYSPLLKREIPRVLDELLAE